MMNNLLVLKSMERRGGRHGREILLSFTGPFPGEMPREWIHLPSLNRLRFKPLKGSEPDAPKVRIKGLGKDALRRGDRFVPLNAPGVASRRFYGYLDSRPRLPVSGELNLQKQKFQFRISAAAEKGAGIVLLELPNPLYLIPGSSVDFGNGSFTPLSVHCYRKISRDTIPLKAQGWLPKVGFSGSAGTLKSTDEEGDFLFFHPWLDWVRGMVQGASRKEGGLETSRLNSLLGIPPYLTPDLLSLFGRKEWFHARKGIILDAEWDYSNSLSPMSRSILDDLRRKSFLLDKIVKSPRYRSLELLVRTGLAAEIEDGLFVDSDYLRKVYRQVTALRKEDPDIGLSELARHTELKKRVLIPLLQYGDEQE